MSAPPTKYVRVFDFNNFSTLYPSVQQPGLQIDAELNALKVTSDATIDRLALIQRQDGALYNAIVTVDSLSSDVLALLGGTLGYIRRGAWVTVRAFAINDVVTVGNASYVALIAHTSGVFATDLAAGKWALLSYPGIAADGTTVVTADIPLNAHKITGLATGTVGTDAVNKAQMDAADAAEVIARNAAIVAATPAATTAVSGLLKLSTPTEVGALTDNTEAVTPFAMAQVTIASRLAQFSLSR